MSKPIHIRKIADDVNIDDVWWREGDNGMKVAKRKAREIEQYLDCKIDVSCYSDYNNRQHEYYLSVIKDSLI